MIKRMLIMLIAVGLVLGGVFGFISFKGRMIKEFMAAQSNPPQTVSTTRATYQDWLPEQEAVGTVRAVRGADLGAEVAGIVEEIRFRQGEDVAAGTLLVQLRAQDDIARLKSLKAAAELARITYQRDKEQLKVKAVSQQALDTDAANLDQAVANVAQQQALVDKKSIRAPFAGRLGVRLVDPGQYLEAGTAVVTVQALDPIFVDFLVPQQALGELRQGQAIQVRTDAYPGRGFAGEVAVINPKVDTDTRNVQIRAQLNNPEHLLLPGMYAAVTVSVGKPQRHLTLPRTAITFNPYGATVFKLVEEGKDEKGNPKLVARQNFVTTGAARGDQIAVTEGVAEGDTVVTSGQMKLRNGTPVRIDNSVPPSEDSAPKPVDE
ncbi:MAG: efflux transporter periplasmic adaptor subunit [Proteobacteria bacterium]|nr:efflux transporter periplasmic adaptor subunit [Pseudomonadota bacterium]